MDHKQIKTLIKIFEESTIHEIELETGEGYIRLAKNTPVIQSVPHVVMNEMKDAPVRIEIEKEAPVIKSNALEIKAPLVGTFYASQSPTHKAYVSVGQKVNAGDVVCIVESMKVMNEIKSPHSGIITEILVQNQEMVEYDQVLFKVE